MVTTGMMVRFTNYGFQVDGQEKINLGEEAGRER